MRGGIKTVIPLKENEKDLWDIPKIVQKMTVKPVSRIEEVLKTALEHDPYTFIPTTPWALKERRLLKKAKPTESENIVL